MEITLKDNIQKLQYLSAKIDSNNPINNLKKGYSLVFKDEISVKADDKINKNDKITVRTYNQILDCTVDAVRSARKKGTI